MKICKVEGCERKHSAKGYCNTHIRQIERHGELRPDIERPKKCSKCCVHGCNNFTKGNVSTCSEHSDRISLKIYTSDDSKPDTCTLFGCTRVAYGQGMCRVHYSQAKRVKYKTLGDLKQCDYTNCDGIAIKNNRCQRHIGR